MNKEMFFVFFRPLLSKITKRMRRKGKKKRERKKKKKKGHGGEGLLINPMVICSMIAPPSRSSRATPLRASFFQTVEVLTIKEHI